MNSTVTTKNRSTRRLFTPWLWLPLVIALTGCEPTAMTLLGMGASTGFSYTLSGYAYKTFTKPADRVKQASIRALARMDIKVAKTEQKDDIMLIVGEAQNRTIEIELEAITPKATNMRVVTHKGAILKDKATATEIVMQTEDILYPQLDSARYSVR